MSALPVKAAQSAPAISHDAMQVLPESMMLLASPCPPDIILALEAAVERLPSVDPFWQHEQVQLKAYTMPGFSLSGSVSAVTDSARVIHTISPVCCS